MHNMNDIRYLSIYTRVLVASEQVPVASKRVGVASEYVPMASRQVIIGYECTPKATLGAKMPPVSSHLTSSHDAEIGRFSE